MPGTFPQIYTQVVFAVMFSDLTRMVSMQNLFHDGGFSFTGVTQAVIDQMEK
jgi:enoyl-[acyl-carrier protein] reductase I